MGKHISHDPFPSRPRIIFMGTPHFAVPTLRALIHEKYKILSVVTQPDRPKGEGTETDTFTGKDLCQKRITLLSFRPKRLDDSFLNLLLDLTPDLLIVVAFGQIIPGTVLSSAKCGGINIHGSLLPHYRGSAPIQWAVINNEKKTGLTTMFMG